MAEQFQAVVDAVEVELSEKGWSYVETDVDPADLVAVHALLSATGRHLTQDNTVSPEISIITPGKNSRALADTNYAMSFHTDNVYLDNPCRSVALFCGVQAVKGGENELVDGLQVVRELPEDVQEQLLHPRWRWTNPTSQKIAGPYAVFDYATDRLRWWRTGMRDLTLGALAAADTFEDALNASEQREIVLMKPGDMLVTDNSRVLHSRRAFSGDRRVHRARYW